MIKDKITNFNALCQNVMIKPTMKMILIGGLFQNLGQISLNSMLNCQKLIQNTLLTRENRQQLGFNWNNDCKSILIVVFYIKKKSVSVFNAQTYHVALSTSLKM